MDRGGHPRDINERIYRAIFGPPTAFGYQFEWPDSRFESFDPYNPAPDPVMSCPGFTHHYENAEMLIPGYCNGGASWRVEAHTRSSYRVAVKDQTGPISGSTLALGICLASLHYRWRVARGEVP